MVSKFIQIISAFHHRHDDRSVALTVPVYGVFVRTSVQYISRVYLTPPAGTVPRGDAFARTVEMCFIVKFMFISFRPSGAATQAHSGGGAVRLSDHLVIPLSVGTNAQVAGFKDRPYNPLHCSNDYSRLFRAG